MSKVMTGASMSLDGYVAAPADPEYAHLFAWYGNGDVAIETADEDMTMHVSVASADYIRTIFTTTGAVVCGRGVFDFTNGWDGNHPIGCPVVCMTHNPPDRLALRQRALRDRRHRGRRRAGEDAWRATGPSPSPPARSPARPSTPGLVDEVCIDLVPVLLGEGTSYFDALAGVPLSLEDPTVIEGTGVTHLRYRVVKAGAARRFDPLGVIPDGRQARPASSSLA